MEMNRRLSVYTSGMHKSAFIFNSENKGLLKADNDNESPYHINQSNFSIINIQPMQTSEEEIALYQNTSSNFNPSLTNKKSMLSSNPMFH